jgi:hypothetical protein
MGFPWRGIRCTLLRGRLLRLRVYKYRGGVDPRNFENLYGSPKVDFFPFALLPFLPFLPFVRPLPLSFAMVYMTLEKKIKRILDLLVAQAAT